MDDNQNRAMGAVMGTLIGDALGVGPHWYYDLEQLKKDYGEWIDNYTKPRANRYHTGLEAGENSQTGQVVTMLLESISDCGEYKEPDFTKRLDDLLKTLDGTPQSGRYTDKAMRDVWRARQKKELDWTQAGGYGDTAEAAIRTPVLAARYYKDIKGLTNALRSNVLLTHRDPFVAGQSAAFGLIIGCLIEGNNLGDSSKTIFKKASKENIHTVIEIPDHHNGKIAISFNDSLLQPSWSYKAANDPAIKIEPASAVCRLFGLACTLGFMLPAAYYLASRFKNDFSTAVLSAINGGGNNMARASLTGALVGAQVGLSGIPEYLIKGLFDHERLLKMTEKITA